MKFWKSDKTGSAATAGARLAHGSGTAAGSKAATITPRRALALLLAAILLVTMLPLAGMAGLAAGNAKNSVTAANSFNNAAASKASDLMPAAKAIQASGFSAGGADFGLRSPDRAPAFLSSFTAHAASNPTSGDCGDNVKWKYNTSSKTLTISGSGAMWDWDDPLDETAEDFAPWLYYYYDEIKTITIQSGVTEIGMYNFAECEALTSVTIPNSVTAIWDGAFQQCVSLKSVTIPNSVKTIAQYAFAFCDSLSTATVPASVTKLSNMAFFYSDGNETIKVASGNSTYKDIGGVVYYKDNNELMIYPSGKKDHIYTVPDGTKAIGAYSMCYNTNLRAVIMPESVIAIGSGAFMFDEHLMRIGLPASVILVDEYAFSACNAMRDVYYAGTQAKRSSIGIYNTENDKFTGAVWHYQTAPKDAAVALFEDVADDAYYAEPVKWAATAGVTSGTSDITFSPDAVCTRAQMVTFLWRAAGSPEPASMAHPFTDVPKGIYYEKAVVWAVKEGITNGMSPTSFGPDAKVTRGQTVTFLYRWKGSPAISDTEKNPFEDVYTSDYYYKPVLWAVKNKITNGTTIVTFEPGSNCTRGQIVTFLYRAVK